MHKAKRNQKSLIFPEHRPGVHRLLLRARDATRCQSPAACLCVTCPDMAAQHRFDSLCSNASVTRMGAPCTITDMNLCSVQGIYSAVAPALTTFISTGIALLAGELHKGLHSSMATQLNGHAQVAKKQRA